MKWILFFCLLGLLLVHSSSKFDPNKLYREIGRGSEETSVIAPLLDQPYTYLNEGAQTYAFVSKDGAYVLKLFKAQHQKRFKFSRFWKRLTQEEKDPQLREAKWRIKFQNTCRRYKMALLDLKEETGLIYLHFQHSPTPLPVKLQARGVYTVDLSKLPFILQKKAVLAPNYCRQHPIEGEKALRELFKTRLEKGYSDPRQSLNINYGFVEDQPIQIDVGKIEPFEGDKEEELEKIYSRLDAWISAL